MSAGKHKRKEQRRQRKLQESRRTRVVVTEEKKMAKNEIEAPAKVADNSAKEVNVPWSAGFWRWVRGSRSLPDWTVAGFTAVLATVAIFQLRAMTGQLNAMGGQLDVMRKDQRAWISVEEKQDPTFSASAPLVAILNVKNTGKTPASLIYGKAWIELVPNLSQPHFEVKELGHLEWFSGMIAPNAIHEREVARTDVKPGSTGIPSPLNLTEDEMASINESRAWVAVHGIVQYEDVFKTKHWARFCYPSAHQPGSFSYGSCISYNQVDDN